MAAGRLFPLLCAAADSRARDAIFMTWIHWPPRQQLASERKTTATRMHGGFWIQNDAGPTQKLPAHSKQEPSSHPCRLLSAPLRLIAAMVFTLGDKPCLWRQVCHGGGDGTTKEWARRRSGGQGRERWGRRGRNLKWRHVTRAKKQPVAAGPKKQQETKTESDVD